MKFKFILILSILATSSLLLHSQSLTLHYNGEDVSNGEITIGGSATANEYKAIFIITNVSDAEVAVKAKKTVRSDIEGSYNTFCLGSCFPPETVESPDSYIIGAGESTTSEDFYMQFYPEGNSGDAQIAYEVFVADNPDDKVTVTVNIAIWPTSVTLNDNEIGVKAYPNPVAGQAFYVEYSLPSNVSNAKLSLYNLLGVRVYEQAVSGKNGTIEVPVHQLPKGVYLYSVNADGVLIKTNRLLIM